MVGGEQRRQLAKTHLMMFEAVRQFACIRWIAAQHRIARDQWPSTSWNMILRPHSARRWALQRRTMAVCGSNRLTSFSDAGTVSP